MLSFLSYIHTCSSLGFLRKLSQIFGYCLYSCYASKIKFPCYICCSYFCFKHFEHLLNWSYLRSVGWFKPQPYYHTLDNSFSQFWCVNGCLIYNNARKRSTIFRFFEPTPVPSKLLPLLADSEKNRYSLLKDFFKCFDDNKFEM